MSYWHLKEGRPAFDASVCTEAFCADELIFEEWLQYVFLGNARNAAAAHTLPRSSVVGARAVQEYEYMSVVEEALPLKELLQEFDAIITGDA